MNRMTRTRITKRLALGLAALALAAAPSFAQSSYDLCASDGTVTMPDGAIIPIWGYADITGGGACTAGLATLPGPVLEAADGDTLTINLSNALSVPVSIFIPGASKALAPVVGLDPQGRERLQSLDATVAPGGTLGYSWTVTAGTYLYHSGTDLRTQVPMGMYGALRVIGGAYPAVAQDEVLVFSEIDPNLNADPMNFGGARVSTWKPAYFLINGASHPLTANIAVDVSSDVLLRFVNAGLETFVPTLGGGLYMDVIAEDGNLYPYAVTQYGLELQAGKTYDAIINAGSEGSYALYDRALHITGGGLVTNILAGIAAGAPSAVADAYPATEDTLLSVAAAAGVLSNDLDADGISALPATYQAELVSGAAAGTLTLFADGSFDYTPDPDFNGNDIFSYRAVDTALPAGPSSNVTTVMISVAATNDAPVLSADAYEAVEGELLSVAAPGLLANDSDVDGDALTVSLVPVVAPLNGAVTLFADGSFEYSPALAAPAVDSFTYEACDPSLVCSTAVVDLSIVAAPANIAPFANDDFAETARNTAVVINLTNNDVDADGTINVASVVITTGPITQFGGTVVSNGDGTVTYTPKNGYRGSDLFQYTVQDNAGATSNVASVHINVLKP